MSFWPCPTCETSNATAVARCDVCGAPQPFAVAGPKTPTTARPVPPARRGAAVRPFAPPTAAVAPVPAAHRHAPSPLRSAVAVAPVTVDRRTTSAPPPWSLDELPARLQLMQFMARASAALRRWLRG